jgi:hypothetical protein
MDNFTYVVSYILINYCRIYEIDRLVLINRNIPMDHSNDGSSNGL